MDDKSFAKRVRFGSTAYVESLAAAERRGYQRGVDDAAKVADDERLRCAPNTDGDKWYVDRMLARVTSATFIRDAIRALGAKPHD